MGNISIPEIAVILGIAFLIFGSKRLPEIGKSIGKTIREFKKSLSGESEKSDSEKTEK